MAFYMGIAVRDPEAKPVVVKELIPGVVWEGELHTEYQIHIFKGYNAARILLLAKADEAIGDLAEAHRLNFGQLAKAAWALTVLEDSDESFLEEKGVKSIAIGNELVMTIGDFDKFETGIAPTHYKIVADHRNCTMDKCEGIKDV